MSKRSTTTDKSAQQCVCGSEQPTHLCCLPYIKDATRNAPSAQALMRSRYTAYTLQRAEYLLRTWHPDTRPQHLTLDADIRWLGLKLKRTDAGQPGDLEGRVEFIARFKIGSRADRIHEDSRFVFANNGWLYVDGEIKHQPAMRPGQNASEAAIEEATESQSTTT
ncbi:MAG: SEC-C motif-containing protein [Gammaproteobacteria bacterium]|jgi:SEC-C motif-containing protein